ncbi:MAG: HEAT repeat domain-containing protein [Planctomycetes bacterium]|nr:HEAT repeat domain-containing protein [Planctomycetota bacterium]
MSARLIIGTLALALFAPSASLLGQDEEAKSSADPTEHLTALADGLRERKTSDDDIRHEADTKTVEAIDHLNLDFKNYGEKDQKKVADEVERIFKIRTEEEENRIYIAAAAFMSDIGPLGEEPLKSAMKVKHLEKRLEVQVMLIESLGKHKNPKNVELFVDLLKEEEVKVVVAAVKALAEYRDADAKLRKEVTEALVKQYANTHNLDVREKGKNPVWRERLLALEVPMNEALAALTLQSFQSAPEWEKWFNDNRNKKW